MAFTASCRGFSTFGRSAWHKPQQPRWDNSGQHQFNHWHRSMVLRAGRLGSRKDLNLVYAIATDSVPSPRSDSPSSSITIPFHSPLCCLTQSSPLFQPLHSLTCQKQFYSSHKSDTAGRTSIGTAYKT